MAANPKARQRRRKQVADKIVKGELLTNAEAEWYQKESLALTQQNPPYTAADAAIARDHRSKLLEAKREGRLEGMREAKKDYKAFAEGALESVATVQQIALQKVIQQATFVDESGETRLDPSMVKESDLRVALQAANTLADRVLGKATQRSEVKGDLKMGLFQMLEQRGELE